MWTGWVKRTNDVTRSLGLRDQDVAAAIQMTPGNYSKYKSGALPPTTEFFLLLSYALDNISPAYLMYGLEGLSQADEKAALFIPDRINQALSRYQMGAKLAAELSGIPTRYLNKVLNYERTLDHLQIYRLAVALRLPPDWLLFGRESSALTEAPWTVRFQNEIHRLDLPSQMVSECTGIPVRSLNGYLMGTETLNSSENLRKICELLHVTVGHLLFNEPTPYLAGNQYTWHDRLIKITDIHIAEWITSETSITSTRFSRFLSHNSIPSYSDIATLCELFDCDLPWLLHGIGKTPSNGMDFILAEELSTSTDEYLEQLSIFSLAETSQLSSIRLRDSMLLLLVREPELAQASVIDLVACKGIQQSLSDSRRLGAVLCRELLHVANNYISATRAKERGYENDREINTASS